MGRRSKEPGLRRDKVSSAKRGFGSISVTTDTKQRFLAHCGGRRADGVLLSLLDGAGGGFDWGGLRMALNQRLKLSSAAVLDEVLKEYGMPSE